MLYNCGMIFFILSFFVGYILSFGLVRLRTIRLSSRAGTHIERRCSCSHMEDVTITDVIIKTPDRKWDWGVDDIMPGSDGLGNFGDFEKMSELRFGPGRVQLGLWDVPRFCWVSELSADAGRSKLIFEPWRGQAIWGYGMRLAFVGSDGTVSMVKIFVPKT